MQQHSTTIKLIAIDIDGTLLTPDGEITPRTRAAIRAAQAAGCIVTLATARRYIGARPIADELGLALPLIVYDGALIVSHPSHTILASQSLSAAEVRQAVELFQRYSLQPIVHPCPSELCANEENWTGPLESDNLGLATYIAFGRDITRRMTYELLCTNIPAALRVVAFAEEEALRRALPAVSALSLAWNFMPRGSYASAELSILPRGCSKASGLARLAAHYAMPLAQVMAIGDSYNDVEMLRAAGWGVAMGQAPQPVKAAARAVTTTNREDGVALAIEQYVLGTSVSLAPVRKDSV